MNASVKIQPTEDFAVAEPTRDVPVFTPRFDIVETEEELRLYGDMPGVTEDQVDIRYEQEQLVVRGRVPERVAGIKFLREEYGVGDFHRVFHVGSAIDTDRITAEIHGGVLMVHLPKLDEVKPKRIEVRSV